MAPNGGEKRSRSKKASHAILHGGAVGVGMAHCGADGSKLDRLPPFAGDALVGTGIFTTHNDDDMGGRGKNVFSFVVKNVHPPQSASSLET